MLHFELFLRNTKKQLRRFESHAHKFDLLMVFRYTPKQTQRGSPPGSQKIPVRYVRDRFEPEIEAC
jgi:hypothetical protein